MSRPSTPYEEMSDPQKELVQLAIKLFREHHGDNDPLVKATLETMAELGVPVPAREQLEISPTLKVVTVEVEGLSLGATVAMVHLFEKLALQHGYEDLVEVECSLRMSARNLLEFPDADAEGFKQALDNLHVDAFVSEATL